MFQNQDLSSLENATHAFWCLSKRLLASARTPNTFITIGYQTKLNMLFQTNIPCRLYQPILNVGDLAALLIKNRAREANAPSAIKISEVFPRQGRPAAGRCPPSRRPCDSTNSHERNQTSPSFKKGDQVIIDAATPADPSAIWYGLITGQDMMSGDWYVETDNWVGYLPEKSILHAPPNPHGRGS